MGRNIRKYSSNIILRLKNWMFEPLSKNEVIVMYMIWLFTFFYLIFLS